MSTTTVLENLVVVLKAEASSLTKGVKAAVATTQDEMNKLAASITNGAAKHNKAFKEAVKLVESVRTPIRHYRDVVDELGNLHKAAAITHEQFNLSMLEAKKILPSYRAQIEAAAEATQRQVKADQEAAKQKQRLATYYETVRSKSAQLEQQLKLEEAAAQRATRAQEIKRSQRRDSRVARAHLSQELGIVDTNSQREAEAARQHVREHFQILETNNRRENSEAKNHVREHFEILDTNAKREAAAARQHVQEHFQILDTNAKRENEEAKQHVREHFQILDTNARRENDSARQHVREHFQILETNNRREAAAARQHFQEHLAVLDAQNRREAAVAQQHLNAHLALVDRGAALMEQHRSRRQQHLARTNELQNLYAGGHIDAGTLNRGTRAANADYYGPMLRRGAGMAANIAAGSARMAYSASKYAAAGAVGIGGASLAEYAAFEDQITRAAAVAGGVSDDFKRRMMDNAKQIASSGIISANQLAKGYATLMQAGLEAEHALQALNIGQKFATASAMDLDHALEMLIKTQTVFGMRKADPVANAMEMKRASDIMAKAANISVASAEDFSRAFTTKVGAAARVLRKDMAEIGGLLVVMANQGVTKELAGEQSAQILRDLQASAIKAKDVWKQLGISVFNSSGNMRHVADIFRDLERAMAGASDEQRKEILRLLKFQERSVAATYNLLGLSGAIREADQELRSLNDETGRLAKTIESSLLSQLKTMWNNIRNVGLELGERLAPYAKIAVEYITNLAKSFSEFIRADDAAAAAKRFAEEFKKLSGFLGGVVGELSTWAADTLLPQMAVIAHDAGVEFGKSFWEGFVGMSSGESLKDKLVRLESEKAIWVNAGRGTGGSARQYDEAIGSYNREIASVKAKMGLDRSSLQDRLGGLFTSTYAPGKTVAKPAAARAVGFNVSGPGGAKPGRAASTGGMAAAIEHASESSLPEASSAALAASTPAAIAAEKAHTRAAKYVESLKERIQELIHTEGMNERQVVIWKMQQELLDATLEKGEKLALKKAIAEAQAADIRLIALEKEEKAAKKAAEEHERLVAKAAEIVDRHESPFKKYAKEKKELDRMLSGGLIDQKTFDAEVMTLKQKLHGPHRMDVNLNLLAPAMPGSPEFDRMMLPMLLGQQADADRLQESSRYRRAGSPRKYTVPATPRHRFTVPQEQAIVAGKLQAAKDAWRQNVWGQQPMQVTGGGTSSTATEGNRLLQQNNTLLQQNTEALRSNSSVTIKPAGLSN